MARTLIQSDPFTGTDNANVGSNWSYIRLTSWQGNPPGIWSNAVYPRAGGDNFQVCRWNGTGTFDTNQYAKVTLGNFGWYGMDNRAGVVVRCSADTDAAADFYLLEVLDDNSTNRTLRLAKFVDGSRTPLYSTTSLAIGSGSTVALEAEGSSLRCYVNDTLITTVTDSSLTTGKPGFLIGGDGGSHTPTLDNWEGGDVTAGGGGGGGLTAAKRAVRMQHFGVS